MTAIARILGLASMFSWVGCAEESEGTPVSGGNASGVVSEVSAPIPDVGSTAPGGPLVLVVSLDTVRADALGCYGDVSGWGLDIETSAHPSPHTPVLDDLAARGLRFRWALAHAPTTMSSHASVFSGRDSRGHGVYRNGVAIPDSVPLVTEELSAAGYETMAIVGASVLDRSMGLSRHFDHYDDSVREVVRARTEDSASEVNRRVMMALSGRTDASRPLFLFVHYYDAHSPWTSGDPHRSGSMLPENYQGMVVDGESETIGMLTRFARAGRLGIADRVRARSLYLAEVSTVDHALGNLLGSLEDQGYLDDSFVLVFGDHGEVLDEIPERAYGHGTDVDLAAIHVPLIMDARGSFSSMIGEARVIDAPVGLRDVSATLLDVVTDRTTYGEAHSLLSSSTEERPHFAEATKPHSDDELWPNIDTERSVVVGNRLFSRANWLNESGNLYALQPGQPLVTDPVMALELAARLDEWEDRIPEVVPPGPDPQTMRNLEALGYLE